MIIGRHAFLDYSHFADFDRFAVLKELYLIPPLALTIFAEQIERVVIDECQSLSLVEYMA
jgi:hypothetical protein